MFKGSVVSCRWQCITCSRTKPTNNRIESGTCYKFQSINGHSGDQVHLFSFLISLLNGWLVEYTRLLLHHHHPNSSCLLGYGECLWIEIHLKYYQVLDCIWDIHFVYSMLCVNRPTFFDYGVCKLISLQVLEKQIEFCGRFCYQRQ